jgi:hypothetical protein
MSYFQYLCMLNAKNYQLLILIHFFYEKQAFYFIIVDVNLNIHS